MKVMKSFAELAASVGHKIEAKERKEKGAETTVEDKCGVKGLRIFNLLASREAGKVYGRAGALIMSPEEIAAETGYTVSTVIGVVISLMRNGFARPTSDGKAIKAA